MSGPAQRPVPPVAELRPVAQGVKRDHRLTYRVFRAISIRLTWAVLHTSMTPNQVTVASLLMAAAGLVLTGATGPGASLAGLLLLLAYHLLDRVDGEVARVREHYSLIGIYLDNAGHYVTSAGLFVAVTFHLSPAVGDDRRLWLLGSIGALAAAMARVEKHAPFHLFSQYVLEKPDLVATLGDQQGPLTRAAAKTDREGQPRRRDAITLVRDLVLTLTAFPQTVLAMAAVVVLADVVGGRAGAVALAVVVTIHLLAWLGVEIANLSQNLSAETRRLAGSTDD